MTSTITPPITPPIVRPARPRPWSTGDAGSFAQRTLAVRVPQILEDTVAQNADRFSAAAKLGCAELLAELRTGRLRGLSEDAPDKLAWDRAAAPHVGKSWLELPWYFAESFFYRRLLEAVQYLGARRGADPFLVVKQAEESRMLPRLEAARTALSSQTEPRARLSRLLHLSLWGNRADLSYAVGRAHGDEGDADDLLVDDTAIVVDALLRARRTAILLDNAGTELAFDLLLASGLMDLGQEVTLYAKSHPFFVSDATPVDVERTRTLLGLPPMTIKAPAFMTSSGFLFTGDMPAELVAELRAFDLTILKGDANYRRLVGDAPWPHATPIDVASDFPGPCVALRTCKAEVAVGVPADVEQRARARDPTWLVDGRFGMIQFVRPA